ncbi:MAG TPA: hypothetical protein VJK02_09960 [Anaerolineales bacterium]|nr:hypothetical protein [Anaerolineales bacterium]
MSFTEDFSATQVLRKVLVGWHWILIGAILGGFFGWGLTSLRAPRYEAGAVLSIGFDYARVAEMDDTVTSYVGLRVRDLLLSDETIQAAVEGLHSTARSASAPADVQEFRSRIWLAEEGSRWELAARGLTPEESAAIADAWAESSLRALDQAMIHAIRAAELQTAIYRAGCKLVEDPASPGGAIWQCETPDDSDRPHDLPAELLREASLSKGLLPAMSFSFLQRAEPPSAPVVWGRGGLILAGMLFGIWIAVMALVFRRNGEASRKIAESATDGGGA